MGSIIPLTRFYYGDAGVFGRLVLPSGISLYSVERPWLNNQLRISCIPEGIYALSPRYFFRGEYDTFELLDVPGRSHILIHVANWSHEVEGCIGLGTILDLGNNMVKSSKVAFDLFYREMSQFPIEHDPMSIKIDHVEAVI